MGKQKKATLDVHGTPITVLNQNDQDYISLTDIARLRNAQDPFAVINNWMRARSTIEFLGLWEQLSNPGFKPLDFERSKTEAGSNYSFCRRNAGSRRPTPRASSRAQVAMAARLLTVTLPSSLRPGFPLNSNSTSSRNFSASKTTKIVDCHLPGISTARSPIP